MVGVAIYLLKALGTFLVVAAVALVLKALGTFLAIAAVASDFYVLFNCVFNARRRRRRSERSSDLILD